MSEWEKSFDASYDNLISTSNLLIQEAYMTGPNDEDDFDDYPDDYDDYYEDEMEWDEGISYGNDEYFPDLEYTEDDS